MDVDLSTDLAALLPLVAPLISGHSDLAIGSRLARGARVVRGAKREFISRCYNLILRSALFVRFSDAQCGFKAIRADVARHLLPLVADTGWFFDTELLVLAQRARLRIHEVPVDWVDDPDSRVDIVSTALADLKGVARLGKAFATGALPISELRHQLGRDVEPPVPGVPAGLTRQVVRFAAVGVASTLLYLLLFVLLRNGMGAQPANLLALLISAIANTAANRRLTFDVRGRAGAGRHQFQGLLVFAVGLGLTSGSLALLQLLTGSPPRAAGTRRARARQPARHRRAVRPAARLGLPRPALTVTSLKENDGTSWQRPPSASAVPTGTRQRPGGRLGAAAARPARPTALGPARTAGAARRHRAAVPVGPRRVRLREQLLRRRGAGRHAELEGVAVRFAGLRQRDHRRQATRRVLGDGAVRADLRLQLVEHAGAGRAGRRRLGRPALRGGAPLVRAGRWPVRRRGARADPGGRADVPVQQPGRDPGAAARRGRLLRGARDREGQREMADAGRACWSASGSSPRCCRRSWCCPRSRWST